MVRKLGDSAKAQLAKKRKLGDGALSAKSKKKSKDKKSKKKKRQRLTKGGGTKQAAAAAPADSSSSDSDEEYERERDVARTPAGGAGNGKSKARAKAASSSSSSSSKAKAALYAAPLGRISPEERQQLRSAVALARIKLGSAVHKLLPASHGAPGTKATTLGKKAPTLAATITLDPRAYTLLRRAFGRAAGDESDDDDDDKEEDEEEEAAAAAEGGGIGGGKGGCEGERAALGLPRRKPVPGFGIPRRIGGGAAGAAGSGGGGSGAAALAAYRTFAAELRARARRQGKHMEPAAITAAWRAASDQDKRELRDKAEAAAAAANATATAAAAAAAGGSEDEGEDEDEGAAGGGGGSAAAAACPGFTERVRVNSEAALQHLLGPGAAVRSSAGFRTSAGMVKVAARVLLPAELEYTTAGSGSGSGGGSGRGLAATTPSPSSAGAGAGATAQADPAKGGGAASVAPHRLTLRFSYAFEMQTPGVRGEGGGRAPDRPGRVRCAQLRESKAKGGGLEPFRAAHALSMPAARAPAPAPAPKQQPSPPPPAKSAAAAAGAAAMARAAAAASAR